MKEERKAERKQRRKDGRKKNVQEETLEASTQLFILIPGFGLVTRIKEK